METKYTPKTISKSDIQFSIPLYQRLFEWEEPQITQLLNDLKTSFEKGENKPYYIGMLTAFKKNGIYDLVDGQQRFTVLMLIGVVFGWEDFLRIKLNPKDKVRLSFFARKNDEQYLDSKIYNNSFDYRNAKMEAGIKVINIFLEKMDKKRQENFKDYVFQNLTFFISYLPKDYELHDLNRYFESMNATGRGLENHEILKVDLLKKLLDTADKEYYTKIWNVVSDMDKPLIRQWGDKETVKELRERHQKALVNLDNNKALYDCCNNPLKSIDATSDFKSIRGIASTNVIPSTQIRSVGVRAILSFPEFLLQVLRLQLVEKKKKPTGDFFNIHKLQETFKENLHDESVELFFQNLLKYRILFDYFIIRISNNESSSSTYTLAFNEDDSDSIEREKLIKYQSMLYVSISSNIWLTNTLSFLKDKAVKINITTFLNHIVEFDNERLKEIKSLSLKYGEIDRYWFWRLDYYLWENVASNKLTFKIDEQQIKAILGYAFRANRSIEHLHPQTSSEPWDIENLNSFGNLAMISPSFNSTQSNDDENVKFARIENQIKGKFLLESIKLLLMYQKTNGKSWNTELANNHGNEMIDILINSFSEEYKDIRDLLNEEKKPCSNN